MPPYLTLRTAVAAGAPAIWTLMERSVHGLQADAYTQVQRDAAIGQVFLIDHGLIADGTYYLVVAPDGRLAGAGGWSKSPCVARRPRPWRQR